MKHICKYKAHTRKIVAHNQQATKTQNMGSDWDQSSSEKKEDPFLNWNGKHNFIELFQSKKKCLSPCQLIESI